MTAYRLLARLLPVPFAVRVLLLLGAAQIAGALVLSEPGGWPSGGVVLSGLLAWALGCLAMGVMLGPWGQLRQALDLWARQGRVAVLPEDLGDEAGALLQQVNQLMARAQRSLDVSLSPDDADPLTGALTEVAFRRILGDAPAGWLIGFELLDYDLVRRRFGTDVSDDLLVRLTDTLVGALRQEDMVARFGADRFIVFIAGASAQVADGLRDRLSGMMRDDGADQGLRLRGLVLRSPGGECAVAALDQLVTDLDEAPLKQSA